MFPMHLGGGSTEVSFGVPKSKLGNGEQEGLKVKSISIMRATYYVDVVQLQSTATLEKRTAKGMKETLTLHK